MINKYSAKYEYYYCSFFNRVYRKNGNRYHVLAQGWVKYEGTPNLSKMERISHKEIDSCGATRKVATHVNAPAMDSGRGSRATLAGLYSNKDEMRDLINTGMFFVGRS